METVSVTIDGKIYRMACDKGQEDHLTHLAAQLDKYISHLKSNFGEIGDHRLSVMAGIMILDEMEELKKEHQKLKENHALFVQENQEKDQNTNKILHNLTQRVEKLAHLLNSKQSQETEQQELLL
ncbi:cell division protein ZapA [Bartonella ancashensis]|uniref:Cell division protein ZapA n=1 Tax=Bartonella ancashensis TaxID=1318743 RepID=A0A0M5KSD8_9HYPH|nr:cell division protein ZapA [Bartonella ancashensis]ALE03140.1 hypothetical protein PU02_0326 [Bartonella ancashensis]